MAALRAQEPPPIMGGSVDVDAPPDFSPDADEPATPAPAGARRACCPRPRRSIAWRTG